MKDDNKLPEAPNVVVVPRELTDLLVAGFKLIPCREHTKIPKIPGWPDAASNNLEQIIEWLSYGPCNWAVLIEPGIFVIDVEGFMDDGVGIFLPPTLQCMTPQGTHLYYRGDVEDIGIKHIAHGIEVYGPGRTIMVPPSRRGHPPNFLQWKWRSSATFPIAHATPDMLNVINGTR